MHVKVQFSYHHLLKRLSFLHCFAHLLWINCPYVWAYILALSSVSLICVAVFIPVPYSLNHYKFVVVIEIREHDATSFLLSQGYFGYSGSSVLFCFVFFFTFKLYTIALVLPNIEMNPPQVYMCSPSWTLYLIQILVLVVVVMYCTALF